MSNETVEVTVRHEGGKTTLTATRGRTLRDLLLERGFSPYTAVTARLNCGGRGLCATCGVRIRGGEAPPTDPHDRFAERFGYPRLSCQIAVEDDLTVEIPDKVVWGRRE